MISSLCWNVLLLKAISAQSSLCSGLSSRLRASCVIGRLPLYRLLCQEHCFLVFLNKPDCHSEQDSSCCLWAALPALLQQRRQLPRKGPGSLRWNQLRCPEGSQASLWAPAGSHTYPTRTPCPGTAACLAVNQLHSNFTEALAETSISFCLAGLVQLPFQTGSENYTAFFQESFGFWKNKVGCLSNICCLCNSWTDNR